MLMIPLFPVDGEELSFVTGHPGVFALVITISTALVLAFGIPTSVEKSKIGKGLVVLGKYSYSIYLTHFPIIVIYNSQPFGGTIYGVSKDTDLIILVAIISVASFLLHRFVEAQRLPTFISNKWQSAVVLISATTLAFTTAFNYLHLNSLEKNERLIFNAEQDRSAYRCGKIFRILNPTSPVCELTGLSEQESKGNIMLAGNSHADAAKPVFIELAKKKNLRLFFFVSNSTMNPGSRSAGFYISQALENNVSVIFVHQSAMSFDYNTLISLVLEAKSNNIHVAYLEPIPVWKQGIPKSM